MPWAGAAKYSAEKYRSAKLSKGVATAAAEAGAGDEAEQPSSSAPTVHASGRTRLSELGMVNLECRSMGVEIA